MQRNELTLALKALTDGELVVYPTDTLYALGANIYNQQAVRKIFSVKKRSLSQPLPIAVADGEHIKQVAFINKKVEKVCKRFLPGTLTIVLPKRNEIPDIVTNGLDKIAIRIPRHDCALKLLKRFGPLTITSANIHGKPTPETIKDIQMLFNKQVSVYLDGGLLDGRPSTIVDLTGKTPVIIRQGSISLEEIKDALRNG
jgi:L-threonylcarbamoyladenylate synthase